MGDNMPDVHELYDRCKMQIDQLGSYREFEHEPVLDYDMAAVIRAKFGLTGVESKNLFLRTKKGSYCMLVTLQEKRADFGRIKEVIGERVSVATDEELKERTGCEPGCAVPFGLPADIILIVDRDVFDHSRLIFSPGPPERTVEMEMEAVRAVFEKVPNRVEYL